jgi:hypothetical protein
VNIAACDFGMRGEDFPPRSSEPCHTGTLMNSVPGS